MHTKLLLIERYILRINLKLFRKNYSNVSVILISLLLDVYLLLAKEKIKVGKMLNVWFYIMAQAYTLLQMNFVHGSKSLIQMANENVGWNLLYWTAMTVKLHFTAGQHWDDHVSFKSLFIIEIEELLYPPPKWFLKLIHIHLIS